VAAIWLFPIGRARSRRALGRWWSRGLKTPAVCSDPGEEFRDAGRPCGRSRSKCTRCRLGGSLSSSKKKGGTDARVARRVTWLRLVHPLIFVWAIRVTSCCGPITSSYVSIPVERSIGKSFEGAFYRESALWRLGVVGDAISRCVYTCRARTCRTRHHTRSPSERVRASDRRASHLGSGARPSPGADL
jgi:hypothetical protein